MTNDSRNRAEYGHANFVHGESLGIKTGYPKYTNKLDADPGFVGANGFLQFSDNTRCLMLLFNLYFDSGYSFARLATGKISLLRS